jgi:hypothetical protein
MRERPILFNGDMVRAILAGRKVQTRRAIAPQPYIDASGNFCWNGSNYGQDTAGVPMARTLASQIPSARTGRVLCPFGKIGDRLWVRETWGRHPDYPDANRVVHRAEPGSDHDAERWRPSIHMPRWACRLVLEITAVRVERLQDITSDDVLAEGITTRFKVADAADDLRIQFRDLWNDTGGDWDSNPWVWVIDFNRVEVAGG